MACRHRNSPPLPKPTSRPRLWESLRLPWRRNRSCRVPRIRPSLAGRIALVRSLRCSALSVGGRATRGTWIGTGRSNGRENGPWRCGLCCPPFGRVASAASGPSSHTRVPACLPACIGERACPRARERAGEREGDGTGERSACTTTPLGRTAEARPRERKRNAATVGPGGAIPSIGLAG